MFDRVGDGIVDCEGNVVVVRSPPGGEIVVITVDVGLFLVVRALLVQLTDDQRQGHCRDRAESRTSAS